MFKKKYTNERCKNHRNYEIFRRPNIFKTNCIYEFEEEISTNDINLSLIAREDKFISTRKRKKSSPGDRLRDNFVIFAQSLNNI